MGEPVVLRSSMLTSAHAFPTREGGVSTGPFASLNASLAVGDEPAHVARNLERLARCVGVTAQRLATVHQVHGLTVLEVTEGAELGHADGLVTSRPGLAVGVRTADCLPILIEDRERPRVAAVHAGWRGVIGEIVLEAVDRFVAAGSQPGSLRVAVGPAIQACCFEVDGDLPQRFEARFGAEVIRPQAGKQKVHLDLGLAVTRTLERAGVPPQHIDVMPHCTRCDTRFFSHRRDQGLTGRHLSLIRCG